MIKIFMVVIAIVLIGNLAFGYKLPNEQELNEFCIPVIMHIDNQTHWFYYKHISQFDENGLRVQFGKDLSQEAFYPSRDIINLYDAINRYNSVKEKHR